MLNKITENFPLAFDATLKPLNNRAINQTTKRIAIMPNPVTINKLEIGISLINSGLIN